MPRRRLDNRHGSSAWEESGKRLLQLERVQAVRIHAGYRHRGSDAGECLSRTTTSSAYVVVVHCFTEDDVGVRIESPGELVSVVLQIGFDGELTTLEWILRPLTTSAEAALKLEAGPVAHLPDPPGYTKPVDRTSPGAVIVTPSEGRIGSDCTNLE